MERIIRFFVERHLLVNVLTAAVVVVGVMTAMRTHVEGFPTVDLPRFIITASLPGASARDVETKLTIPIEDALRDVDGLDSYSTVVTDNRSVTEVALDDDTPRAQILDKEREIRDAIDAITDFPEAMTDPPTIFRMDPSKQPVLEIALAGDPDALAAASRRLERRLLRVEGVGEVDTVGLPDPELRVLVEPRLARAHGVTLLDVVRAIERRNVSNTGGVLETTERRRQVVMWGRFDDPAQVGDVILRFDESGALRVRDVARLELGREDTKLIAGTNGRPGLSVVVTKRADADIVRTRDGVVRALEQTALPAGVEATVVNDSSYEVRNRLRVLASNGLMGLVLVAGIVFLFLAPSAAIWVCAGVPIVILGVLAVMPMVGMGINFISTVAFVIVLGMLVDDAVVVSEKILLRRQDGLDPKEAAVSGATAVARPVIAAAITTLLAFGPLLAIGGMPQKIIWQIPAVVCIALTLSLLESFLILPAHMSMVRGNQLPRPKRAFMLRLEAVYRVTLERGLPHRGKIILGFVGMWVVLMALIVPRMHFELFPQDSSPAFFIKVTLPPGSPIEQTESVVEWIEVQLPPAMGQDLLAVTSRVGHQDVFGFGRKYGSAENEGLITAHLESGRKQHTSAEWIAFLKERLQVPEDVELVYEAAVDGPPGLEPVQIYVMSNDDDLRRETAMAVKHRLESEEGVVDISIDERFGMRQIDLNVDPERLARLGLDAQDVGLTLKAAYYGLVASEIRDLDDTTDIRVVFEPAARRSLDALLDAPLRNARGELVAIRDVVAPVELPALSQIHHRNGLRTATVTAGFAPGSDLTATSLAKQLEREFLPAYSGRQDLEVELGGEVVQSRRAMGDLAMVAGVVVLAIGAVIAVMLGSFLEAFFVITIVPFAILAVVVTFFLHGMKFSLLPIVGSVGLAGVVVNAAIVMVDSVHVAQRDARGLGETARTRVMVEALVARLRPILVTSLSTFGGVMPTAYGLGGWDSVMSPLSLALGWGLAFSSVVTLLLVPSLYVTANDFNRTIDRWRRRRHARAELDVAA